ncbi:hypothetical protein CCR75_007148 [Bremia lactucae]|uniref:Uncharacterized protein n=1 Tax=Bremia lactucae TaxID=4779 RepID=A0A976IL09_BRELC|nr:hypothetical protein CCR75_007148 [Bremia lactucae]
MWINSRDLTGDDDVGGSQGSVWGFASSSRSPVHKSIGVAGSRVLWNRMEPAEEEREEEALPSYLSYLQPSLQSASASLNPHAPPPRQSLYGTTPGLLASPPSKPVVPSSAIEQVTRKSAELAQALEQVVRGAMHGNCSIPSRQCQCNCDHFISQLQEMGTQVQALQNHVFELTKPSFSTSLNVGNALKNGMWTAHAPPFVPKSSKHLPSPPLASIDNGTATVLSDRISTLEGRQSAFQSQLAQIVKVLGIPTGKANKHGPVKPLLQTLREEVDCKVEQATAEATAKLTAQWEKKFVDTTKVVETNDFQHQVSSNVVLAALAKEHETSLARLSGSLEALVADETRQRVALEARVCLQLNQHEEWLQQLEGVFGSPHAVKPEFEPRCKNVCAKVTELEQKWNDCWDRCQRFEQVFSNVARSRELKPLHSAIEDKCGG